MTEPTQKPRPAPATQLALIQLPSGEERLEPVLAAGPEGIHLLRRSSDPSLQRGSLLTRVRLFADGACCLDSQAVVQEVTEMTSPQGTTGQRLSLRVESPRSRRLSNAAMDSFARREVIEDVVQQLLRNRNRLMLTPQCESPGEAAAPGYVEEVTPDGELFVRHLPGSLVALEAGSGYDLHAEVHGNRLAIRTRFIERRGNRLRFALPTLLLWWRSRRGTRIGCEGEGIEVSFTPPFDRSPRTRPVLELSPHGLAIVCRLEDELMAGTMLTNLCIRMPSGNVKGRGIVRNLRRGAERLVAGIELVGVDPASHERLADYVAASAEPEVRRVKRRERSTLRSLYEGAGLFNTGSPEAEEALANHDALWTRGKELVFAMLGRVLEDVQGGVELARTYRQTWSLQHLVLLPRSRMTAARLLAPAVQAARRRPDCRYVHAIIEARESDLVSLRQTPRDEPLLTWREWRLLRPPNAFPTQTPGVTVEAGDLAAPWITDQLAVRHNALEIEALDLAPSELSLESICELYRAAGLERGRALRLATVGQEPAGYSLVETMSPGVSLVGHGVLARLYASESQASPAKTLVALGRDAALCRSGVLIMVDPSIAGPLLEAGLQEAGTGIEIVAASSARQQFVELVSLLQ